MTLNPDAETNFQPAEPVMSLARTWDRFVARFLDGLIVLLPALLGITLSTLSIGPNSGGQAATAVIVGNLISFLVWCYNSVYLTSRTGQSFGKRVRQLKVVLEDGSPPSLLACFIRELIYSVVPLEVVAIFFTAESQALHDLAMQTHVIKLERP